VDDMRRVQENVKIQETMIFVHMATLLQSHTGIWNVSEEAEINSKS
jgi:hypothetical protein